MPRGNGSYIGQTVSPNSNVASGIWTVREAETYLRADKWPAQPTVPGAPTGTAGDGQVALTWTAPTGGSTVTDYIVQYSSNGGSSWTTFSDGVSTATSATVTGLTNGTGYIFRIIAVNALGQGPAGSASGTITPAAINVALLMHFDGTDGSTTFTDSSPNSLAVTAYGDAEISTSQSKFGGASGYFDGTGDYLEVASSQNLSLGDGDFTIEMWLRLDAQPTYILCSGIGPNGNTPTTAGWNLRIVGGSLQMERFDGAAEAVVSLGSWSPPTGQWIHFAVCRKSGTIRAYEDGVLIGSAADSTAWDHVEEDEPLFIGRAIDGSGEVYVSGYIDELRIIKGTGVYDGSSFTPPTAPF